MGASTSTAPRLTRASRAVRRRRPAAPEPGRSTGSAIAPATSSTIATPRNPAAPRFASPASITTPIRRTASRRRTRWRLPTRSGRTGRSTRGSSRECRSVRSCGSTGSTCVYGGEVLRSYDLGVRGRAFHRWPQPARPRPRVRRRRQRLPRPDDFRMAGRRQRHVRARRQFSAQFPASMSVSPSRAWNLADINGDGRHDHVFAGRSGPVVRHDSLSPEPCGWRIRPGRQHRHPLPQRYRRAFRSQWRWSRRLPDRRSEWPLGDCLGQAHRVSAPPPIRASRIATGTRDFRGADMNGDGLGDIAWSEVPDPVGNTLKVRARFAKPSGGFARSRNPLFAVGCARLPPGRGRPLHRRTGPSHRPRRRRSGRTPAERELDDRAHLRPPVRDRPARCHFRRRRGARLQRRWLHRHRVQAHVERDAARASQRLQHQRPHGRPARPGVDRELRGAGARLEWRRPGRLAAARHDELAGRGLAGRFRGAARRHGNPARRRAPRLPGATSMATASKKSH